MKKLKCPANEDHDYDLILRGAKKALESGLPTCYCGREMLLEEGEEDEDAGDA